MSLFEEVHFYRLQVNPSRFVGSWNPLEKNGYKVLTEYRCSVSMMPGVSMLASDSSLSD